MSATLSIRSVRKAHGGKILVLIFSVIFAVLSYLAFVKNDQILANPPADIVQPLWITPQAERVKALGLSAGLPAAQVTLNDFKQKIGNQPYQYFFWNGWEEGLSADPYDRYNTSRMRIIYQAKVIIGSMETYYVVYEPIVLRGMSFNWNTHTYFDSTKNRFVSVADSPTDLLWNTGMWCAGISCLFLFILAWMIGYLFYHKKTYGYWPT